MKKPSEKARPRTTPSPETDGRDEAASTVAVERAPAAALPAPYRVVWRCSFGPREAAAADAESGPTNDETR